VLRIRKLAPFLVSALLSFCSSFLLLAVVDGEGVVADGVGDPETGAVVAVEEGEVVGGGVVVETTVVDATGRVVAGAEVGGRVLVGSTVGGRVEPPKAEQERKGMREAK
jgi:hypothetical protein